MPTLSQSDIIRKIRYFQDHGENPPNCIEDDFGSGSGSHSGSGSRPVEPPGFRRSDSEVPIAVDFGLPVIHAAGVVPGATSRRRRCSRVRTATRPLRYLGTRCSGPPLAR